MFYIKWTVRETALPVSLRGRASARGCGCGWCRLSEVSTRIIGSHQIIKRRCQEERVERRGGGGTSHLEGNEARIDPRHNYSNNNLLNMDERVINLGWHLQLCSLYSTPMAGNRTRWLAKAPSDNTRIHALYWFSVTMQHNWRTEIWHTSRRAVLLEKLHFPATQEITYILWNHKVHCRLHNSPPLVPIVSRSNPVHANSFHFLNSHINIIPPSTPRSVKWTLPLTKFHYGGKNAPLITVLSHINPD